MKVVCEKIETLRTATACANIKAGFDTAQLVKSNGVPKGNVLEVVRTAGIMAAQKTPELIPLRRQIPIDSGVIDSEIDEARITVESSVKAIWKTGVEMEAFTAATIASGTQPAWQYTSTIPSSPSDMERDGFLSSCAGQSANHLPAPAALTLFSRFKHF